MRKEKKHPRRNSRTYNMPSKDKVFISAMIDDNIKKGSRHTRRNSWLYCLPCVPAAIAGLEWAKLFKRCVDNMRKRLLNRGSAMVLDNSRLLWYETWSSIGSTLAQRWVNAWSAFRARLEARLDAVFRSWVHCVGLASRSCSAAAFVFSEVLQIAFMLYLTFSRSQHITHHACQLCSMWLLHIVSNNIKI